MPAARRLPQISVPELGWIALVRLDVISDLSRRDQTHCLAAQAKWMLQLETG
jgi:hypothetical protein